MDRRISGARRFFVRIDLYDYEFETGKYRYWLQYINLAQFGNYFGIEIAGREPKKPEFDLDTGFDPEASGKQAEKTIERLKDDLKSN